MKQKIIRTSTVATSLNTFCRGTLRDLSRLYDVVAVSTPDHELQEIAQREGIRVIGVPMSRPIAPLRDLVSLWRLIRVFRRERPTMVHSITPKAGLLSMIAAWICRVPVRLHTFTGLVFPTATGLKQRILSNHGHLSNESCAQAMLQLMETGVHHIILGHLSGENNTPDLALSVAENRAEEAGVRLGKDLSIDLAWRDRVGGVYTLKEGA